MEFDFEAALTTGKDLEKAIGALTKTLAQSPIPESKAVSGVLDATGICSLSFGKPNMGRLWNVTNIAVVGSSDQQALGLVAVYIGNSQNNPLTDVIYPAKDPMPFAHSWNKDQLWVLDNQELYVRAYAGGAAGTPITATAMVLNYPRDNRWSKL